MTTASVAVIVEGHGECEAIPILIRRIASDIEPGAVPKVLKPLRIPGNQLRRADGIERAVELASRKLGGTGGILVVVDCDWEGGCPATDGPELLRRAQRSRADMLISVVLANKEYESWFLASAASLSGKRGLRQELESPANPEAIRGAKEWLTAQMPRGRRYSETVDQPALTAVFDINAARVSDSFDKFYREVQRMLENLKKTP